jgi:hypothetical protein
MATMGEEIPDTYRKTIDIKKPGTRWFPSFGGKGKDRIEWRMFDAPEDEYIAALQIKYVRALLDRAWNVEGAVPLVRRYSDLDVEIWKNNPSKFLDQAEAHLKELGLDSDEFAPALRESLDIQQAEPKLPNNFKKYQKHKTRIQLAKDGKPGAVTERQVAALVMDLERNTKKLKEAWEDFDLKPSGRKLVVLMEEYEWAVSRFKHLMANDARILSHPAFNPARHFESVEELMKEIAGATKMIRGAINRHVADPARHKKRLFACFELAEEFTQLRARALRVMSKRGFDPSRAIAGK